MSKVLFQSAGLYVSSYCGPADTDERTRMRIQIEARDLITTLGYSDAQSLHRVLGAWIKEHGK